MYLYIGYNKSGTGTGTWYAIKNALGEERAAELVERSKHCIWKPCNCRLEGFEELGNAFRSASMEDGDGIGLGVFYEF